jgi:Integrase core domain
VLNEFYRIAFRKKVYRSIDELQADLDVWVREYNESRPHQGCWCFGKTPMQTFLDAPASSTNPRLLRPHGNDGDGPNPRRSHNPDHNYSNPALPHLLADLLRPPQALAPPTAWNPSGLSERRGGGAERRY